MLSGTRGRKPAARQWEMPDDVWAVLTFTFSVISSERVQHYPHLPVTFQQVIPAGLWRIMLTKDTAEAYPAWRGAAAAGQTGPGPQRIHNLVLVFKHTKSNVGQRGSTWDTFVNKDCVVFLSARTEKTHQPQSHQQTAHVSFPFVTSRNTTSDCCTWDIFILSSCRFHLIHKEMKCTGSVYVILDVSNLTGILFKLNNTSLQLFVRIPRVWTKTCVKTNQRLLPPQPRWTPLCGWMKKNTHQPTPVSLPVVKRSSARWGTRRRRGSEWSELQHDRARHNNNMWHVRDAVNSTTGGE